MAMARHEARAATAFKTQTEVGEDEDVNRRPVHTAEANCI